MPWGIQKIYKIQDFLDVVRNPAFPGCREESRKSRKSRISWMPWRIQKIQEIQDFLDAVGNPENQENPGNLGFPGCRGESRKSTKSRIS